MLNSRDLLAAVRAAQGIESNYRLSRLLDVPEKSVQRWNTGKHTPDDAMAVRLAELAGLDPAAVVAAMHAQRCTDDALRPILQRIAQRAAQVGAAVFTAILSVVFSWHPDAQARASTEVSAPAAVRPGIDESTHWRAFLRAVAHLWGVLQRAAAPMVCPCCI